MAELLFCSQLTVREVTFPVHGAEERELGLNRKSDGVSAYPRLRDSRECDASRGDGTAARDAGGVGVSAIHPQHVSALEQHGSAGAFPRRSGDVLGE